MICFLAVENVIKISSANPLLLLRLHTLSLEFLYLTCPKKYIYNTNQWWDKKINLISFLMVLTSISYGFIIRKITPQLNILKWLRFGNAWRCHCWETVMSVSFFDVTLFHNEFMVLFSHKHSCYLWRSGFSGTNGNLIYERILIFEWCGSVSLSYFLSDVQFWIFF